MGVELEREPCAVSCLTGRSGSGEEARRGAARQGRGHRGLSSPGRSPQVVQPPGHDRRAAPERDRLGVSERRHQGMPEHGRRGTGRHVRERAAGRVGRRKPEGHARAGRRGAGERAALVQASTATKLPARPPGRVLVAYSHGEERTKKRRR